MPELRASAPGLLGIPGPGHAAHCGIATPCADPRCRKIHASVDSAIGLRQAKYRCSNGHGATCGPISPAWSAATSGFHDAPAVHTTLTPLAFTVAVRAGFLATSFLHVANLIIRQADCDLVVGQNGISQDCLPSGMTACPVFDRDPLQTSLDQPPSDRINADRSSSTFKPFFGRARRRLTHTRIQRACNEGDRIGSKPF
jgi:hypothetical protein